MTFLQGLATGLALTHNEGVIESSHNSAPLTDERFWQPLRAILDGEVSTTASMRGAYATDASVYQVFPRAVAFPKHEDDVAAIVQFCGQHGVSIVGRGAGTSLSGQAIGPGLVVDFSRHMNRIVQIDGDARLAVVQPGVILDELNRALASDRLLFAPDPATASRATIGGMIGNNACGTRTIVYGRTSDAIESLRAVAANGHFFTTSWLAPPQWQTACQSADWLGAIYRQLDRLMAEFGEDVRQRIPPLPRIAAGYSVAALVDDRRPRSLSDLIVGSEGTLALVTQATLRLRPYPAATRLVMSAFGSIDEALRSLPDVLKHQPSAVELLDDVLIGEAVRNSATRQLATTIVPPDYSDLPAAILMVEFFGDDERTAEEAARHYSHVMAKSIPGSRHQLLASATEQNAAWEVRRLGLGLISNLPGKRKSIALIEDACLPIDRLPEYHRFVYEVGRQLTMDVSTYGHASVGVLHYKVMLDLHQPDDRRRMREMAEACFVKCCELGGVFSGEHGDGIVRAEFLQRQFGPRVYELFVAIKRLFDPRGMFNPGRKIDAPPLDSLLRYGDGESARQSYLREIGRVQSLFRYADQGGLAGAIEQCNGVGACRQVLKGTMCPSYRATRDERDSTRGRANLLRLAISGQLQPAGLANPELHQALELCLACKACKSECPNAVDMARLKSESLAAKWKSHAVSPSARFIGRMPQRIRAWARFAQLANWGRRVPPVRWWLARRYAIDRRRALPVLARRTFDAWWRTEAKNPTLNSHRDHTPSRGRIALFVDAWHRYLEPDIPIAAVKLFKRLGFDVKVPQGYDGLRSRISVGLLDEARRLASALYRELATYVDQGIDIVCLEPSEASAIKDDLPDLVDEVDLAQRVAAHTYLIDDYVAARINRGELALSVVADGEGASVVVHPHCHQRALFSVQATVDVLKAAGFTAVVSDWGCCGMAGSFGYTHYDVSQQIAMQRFLPGLHAAAESSQQVIATGTSCRQQARDLAGVRAVHWLELLIPKQA